MATPPRVATVELARTLRLIAARRAKVQDTDLERMPDPEQAHPVEMLRFLQTHTRVPRWVQEAEVADALRLCAWLWWEQRRVELAWLKRGRALGLFLAQLGLAFGCGKQAVLDRIDRHEALLAHDRPNEHTSRAARRAAREGDAHREQEQRWVAEHADELTTLVARLTREADRCAVAEEDREWLAEIARDAREGAWSPASMTVLGMAAAEVQTAAPVVALDSARPHAVHHVLARISVLRSAFAALRTERSA